MTLNSFSLINLFIGALSLGLILFGGAWAFFLYRKWDDTKDLAGRTDLENRSYLVFLVTAVALMSRVLAWPLFYIMLQSFIIQVPGAMCIYGVTQVSPGITSFLEISKPIVFFLIGGWLILYWLDRSTKTHPLMKRNSLFLFLISFLAGIDAIGDMALITTFSPGVPVSCCTLIYDIQVRPTAIVPESILGPEYTEILMILYHGLSIILIGTIGLLLKRKRWEEGTRGRRFFLFLFLTFGLINTIITFMVMIEVIAPRLMHLPFHHCLYCLLQYVPLSIVFLSFLLLGTYSLGWALLVETIGSIEGTEKVVSVYIKKLWEFALYSLFASWAMVSMYLLLLWVGK